WFQLSLKEGLTVFRDQEFSADVGSRAVKRIQDVRVLRTYQFAEDGGPMAHPVRPDSYIEISNFYTVTVYSKGAEVIRMIHTLLGQDGFRRGMDLYFERHDGQAVTIDDFVAAMEDANQADLGQFRRWYSQAGTPEVEIRFSYDAETGNGVLELAQRCPDTPGQSDKSPFHIPLRIALLDEHGTPLPLSQDEQSQPAENAPRLDGDLLHLRQPYQRLHLKGLPKGASRAPVVSAGRGFSAPVNIKVSRGDRELAFLMAHDDDPFNRWDAAQNLALDLLTTLIRDRQAEQPLSVPQQFVDAFGQTLTDPNTDRALIAEALRLPGESYIADQMSLIDVEAIHTAREFLRHELARQLEPQLRMVMAQQTVNQPYAFEPEQVGRRALKNLCLGYLMTLQANDVRSTAFTQLEDADNMTDALAALACFTNTDCAERPAALASFEQRWQNDPLVLDKWFSMQAMMPGDAALARVKGLMDHPGFQLANPNRVRSLIGVWASANQTGFHRPDGEGYAFFAETVLDIGKMNPQVAARLATALRSWRSLEPKRREKARKALVSMANAPDLSTDLKDILDRTLA
ncbi:MAG: DUF3458 domain-containing protein, partial [Gammaproteobacteria bacterium]|nr:DUF3458 domain-containing protein [Gammaproteobacteria bacterium]